MNDEWITLPLNEAVSINPPVPLKKGSAYPFVDMQTVIPNEKKVNAAEIRIFDGGGSRFQVGDILMARITPSLEHGKISRFVADDPHTIAHGSTEFIVIRGKPGVTDADFAYYLIRWDYVRQYAISQMTGSSGRQRVPTESLRFIDVTIPPLPEQRAIAAVLGALDDKIELNRRMNRTLEAIAQAVFREMMKNVEEEGSILEFADLLSGGTPSTAEESYWNGNIEWVSAKDVSGADGVFLLDTEKKITQAGIDHSSTKFLPAKTTIVTARGTVGAHCMLGKPMTMNQTNYGLKAKEGIGDYFVYFALSEIVEQLKQQSYGTIFDTITTKTFYSVLCPRPSLDVIQEFEKRVMPLMDAILNNQQQSRTLAALRDALLPRLMRGEVRVRPLDG